MPIASRQRQWCQPGDLRRDPPQLKQTGTLPIQMCYFPRATAEAITMTDEQLALQAVRDAQRILEEYLEPRRTILDKLVEVLERPELLVAIRRIQRISWWNPPRRFRTWDGLNRVADTNREITDPNKGHRQRTIFLWRGLYFCDRARRKRLREIGSVAVIPLRTMTGAVTNKPADALE